MQIKGFAAEAVVHQGSAAEAERPEWIRLRAKLGATAPTLKHTWLAILREGLGHYPYCIEARVGEECVGLLPLCHVRSMLFGRFLVGLPYLNQGGVLSQDASAAAALIDGAVQLADELDVRYLQLRHDRQYGNAAFNRELVEKVHMRLDLPKDADELWRGFDPKVRNQIRKAEKHGLQAAWGKSERLDDFYRVFSENMRDLGTPVYGRRLFAAILNRLGDAEICVVRKGQEILAAGLVLFGGGVAEIPSASSLRRYNSLNANMLLYWEVLRRAVESGERIFDFGRSTVGSNTYRFKAQWGAQPYPAIWQYYVRRGNADDMRPDSPKQQRRIAIWKRLPLWITRLAGPPIVRGIP